MLATSGGISVFQILLPAETAFKIPFWLNSSLFFGLVDHIFLGLIMYSGQLALLLVRRVKCAWIKRPSGNYALSREYTELRRYRSDKL